MNVILFVTSKYPGWPKWQGRPSIHVKIDDDKWKGIHVSRGGPDDSHDFLTLFNWAAVVNLEFRGRFNYNAVKDSKGYHYDDALFLIQI
ncbi:hypothetical protein BTUL_0233g00140 [Botrytis tulipae]|uniref:Uncharacterized protein n=1 Tax=Botrytis tulipae TaxID=87230 RepID=A0A4Z1EF00_9HELO|nr:hypothetical protein BTUL_0233g00140 [Botrytis tulipae]